VLKSLFAKAPKLSDLLTHWQVDIHSHLLPGIDDGSKNSDNSLQLLKNMHQLGVKKWITTPHIITNVWDNNTYTINETLDVLKNYLSENNIDFEVHAAAEYMMDHYFLEKLNSEKLLVLKDQMVLVEMSYINPPIQLFDILYEIQLQGYTPVLAHPERYQFYHNQKDKFEKLKKAGCLFQANLASVVGYYGKGVSTCLDELLKQDMIDFVGSDTHHQRHLDSFTQKVSIKNYQKLELVVENTNRVFL
jgi:tyrosine-protein phosphatase YwqE